MKIHDLRYHHADELLSSPSWARLEYCWLWNHTIPFRYPEQDVHDLLFCQKDIPEAHLVDTGKSILHNTHKRAIALRRDDVERNHAELHHFSSCLLCLRNVQVHFIAVEISVVRRSHGQVKSERRVGHDAYPVTHHG